MNKEILTLSQFKAGDIVLLAGTNIYERILQWFMKLARRRKGLSVPKGLVANHAGILINVNGRLCMGEVLNTVKTYPFPEAYYNYRERMKVLSPKKPYSVKEKEKLSRYVIDDSKLAYKYDVFGLLFQVKYILSGKWVGPVGERADKRLYCTEAVAKWVNKVRPNTFTQQEAVNPLDIELNRYYNTVYDGTNIG